MINDIQISENFRLSEFESPDTKEVMVDPELVKKLQMLRDYLGVPVNVTSGYRTPEHNKKVGGVERSQHKYGKAADIWARGKSHEEVSQAAEKIGFDGVGRYDGFTHVDVRGYRARWNYRKK